MSETVAGATGPLHGLRVIELASEHVALAGKLLGDLGAEVVLVEPPGGHHGRSYAPFADDRPGQDRSLWWWHHHTSKLGVTIDLDDDRELFRRLVATADVVLEGESPGRLPALGVDHPALRADHPALIWVSVTPFGRDGPRHDEQATDLTILAGGGPVWSCGYDDHTLPPVRGGGDQGYNTACLWAVMATLTAVIHRDVTGEGQHIDVNMHAAANVTTEAATYEWLVAGQTVQRQTGRHAAVTPTIANRVTGTDGRDVHTGVPPRRPGEFLAVLAWLDELGIADEFDDRVLLELGAQREELSLWQVGKDPEVTEIFGAAREVLNFIASRLPAHEFFVGAQRRGLACGIVYAPEEVLDDPHFVERGFAVVVEHDDRPVVYPGPPFIAHRSPWRISRPAPRLGEHDGVILGPIR